MLYYKKTPIGIISLELSNNSLTRLSFISSVPSSFSILQTFPSVIEEAFRQLDDYFLGRLKQFSLPLSFYGTTFSNKVWSLLQKIPYGEKYSYKQIACLLGNPKASRAVGRANNLNPLPIFIPCHRVIGSDGKLIGYRGGLGIKTYLLDLEKQYS